MSPLIRSFTICSLFLATVLRADTLMVQDGSQIIGKVLSIENGSVKIETDFAGVLNIAQDQVQSIDMENPIFIEFSGGNTLYGVVSSNDSGTLRVDTKGGEFRSDVQKIQAVWQQGEDSPMVRKHKAELQAKRLKGKYEVMAEIGGTSGNTDSLDVGLGVKAEFKSSEDKLRLYAKYNYSETENEISTDNAKGGIRYERTFYKDYFWYAHNELGQDRTEDLDLYNLAGVGVGYRWIKSEKQNLSIGAGPAYRYESYGDGTDISAPAAEVNVEYDYLFPFGKFYSDLQLIESLDDTSDYRINHELGIEFPFQNSDMKLKAGIGNNYHSKPVRDKERLNTNYFTRLIWSWK